MQEEQHRKTWRRMVVCVLISLLLHGGIMLLFLSLPKQEPHKKAPATGARMVKVHRAPKQEKKEDAAEPEREKEKQTPFAKTDPDSREQLPERKDFVGKRNTRAASDPDSEGLVSEEDVPSMTGEKKDELVTFDQDRQEGDLQYDGKREQEPQPDTPAVTATTPDPAMPQDQPLQPDIQPGLPQPPTPADAQAATEQVSKGTPDATPAETEEQDAAAPDETESTRSETASTAPAHAAEEDALSRGETTAGQKTTTTPTLDSLGLDIGEFPLDLPPATPARPTPQMQPTLYRDPTLADHAQPGFRTNERRSRSAGRFVLGHNASLNVSATPMGRYQEEIYRRIAYWWYRACDDHRGDIIPGKIVVSLRLNNTGRLVNMDLIQRSGASVIQQSFTFGAIRNSSLPPMPENVQAEMVGDLLELIFEFNFN